MSHLINYQQCPSCGHNDIHPVLAVTDHTVSKRSFEVWHCGNCTNRFTQLVPGIHDIGAYYQSVAYVSHSDTEKGLINRLYHLVRHYTLGAKRKLVQKVTGLQSGHLLDIGAGTGGFAIMMQRAGWQITALEPDDTARKNAAQKHGLQLRSAADIYTLPDAQYDVITLWHVLEHVHDLQGYFDRFMQLLKPGGKLVIAVPNYTSSDAEHYGQHWAAWDVPRHLYHFSPKGMQQLATLKGFSLRSVHPMWFDSFYVAMLSEQYKNGKGNLLRAVWNGLISNIVALGDKRKCSSLIYVFGKN